MARFGMDFDYCSRCHGDFICDQIENEYYITHELVKSTSRFFGGKVVYTFWWVYLQLAAGESDIRT
jgi:hypothetical protein